MSLEKNTDLEIEFVDKNGTRMTWFRAFRDEFGYSNYGEYRTSVTSDIPLAVVIYACVLISIAALIATAGIRGKERWYTLVRMIYSLAVGSIVLVSIFGYCWRMGYVNVHSPYIYRSEGNIQATLGVRIGLQTVNLTLSGTFMNEMNTFDYNEEVVLEHVILGPKPEQQAIERGLPQPLLSVLEYFDTDEGQIRYGRACWLAGYIAHILLWAAFAFWVTANILLCSVVWYGALMFTLTGLCMVMSAVLYHILCPGDTIRLPCADGLLVLHYGWCFWSNLVLGSITTVTGLILFTLDQKVPNKLAEFFLLENAIEDNADEYKQIGTVSPHSSISQANTPNMQRRKTADMNNKRLSPTPVNWYFNNGYEPSKKGNPIFIESGHESPYPAYDTADHPKHKAVFTDIMEEDDKARPSDRDIMERNIVTVQTDNLNRLQQVYVDVEASYSRVSTPNNKMCVPEIVLENSHM